MSRRTPPSRKSTALAFALLLCIGGGIAFAFWTGTGTGTGSGTSGTTVAITVVQTSTVTAMGPGDAPQALSGNFNNPNAGSVYVGTVTVSIASVTKAGDAVAGTCDATDYTLANPAMLVNNQVAAGNAVGSWSGATIQFNNKGTNQDACKGATVNLAYAIS